MWNRIWYCWSFLTNEGEYKADKFRNVRNTKESFYGVTPVLLAACPGAYYLSTNLILFLMAIFLPRGIKSSQIW